MHDGITIGLPVLVILLAALWNNQGLRDVKAEVVAARAEAKADHQYTVARVDRVQADLTTFYQILGKHDGKIESLEKRPA